MLSILCGNPVNTKYLLSCVVLNWVVPVFPIAIWPMLLPEMLNLLSTTL